MLRGEHPFDDELIVNKNNKKNNSKCNFQMDQDWPYFCSSPYE